MTDAVGPMGKPLADGELSFELALKCTCGCGYVFKAAQHAFLTTSTEERAIHHIGTIAYRLFDRMDKHLAEREGVAQEN